nr:reverse transcriptase domain-containing protein [Tanacetum cinerariifolium]
KGTVTASKPQTLEEAINIAQRLMDQRIKRGADKSFVSIYLASMLNIPPITLDTTYDIEIAYGNLVARNLFPPLDNPELTIRRRPRVDPTLLNDFEMATNGNGDDVPPPGGGDLPVLDLRTMEELCQPTLNGETFMKRRPEECYDLIENMTAHHNDWDTSIQRRASHSQNPPPAYQAPAYQSPGYQAPIPQPQVVTTTEFTNYMKANDAILKSMQTNMTSLKNSNLELKNMFGQFMKMNTASSSSSRTLPSNTITNPKEDLKAECKTEVTKDTVPPANKKAPKMSNLWLSKLKIKFQNLSPLLLPLFSPLKLLLVLRSLTRNQKLGDPGKFLISCDFPGMDECLALADLGTSINLMPLSVWNKLSLPKLSPTCITLELADCSISLLVGVAEDVFVKTERAFIDVYEGELTLRLGKETVTFNLDQTSRYSANYDAMLVNRIDLIDVACEEYSQEVLGFSVSGNPTPSTEPIVSNSSLTLTPFGDSDFLLKETNAFLAIDDEPISPKIDNSYYDSEGDILLFE